MKKYFLLILLILFLIILIGIFFISCGKSKQPSEEPLTDAVPVVTNKTFSYDGTYSGTFNYEYQDIDRFSGKIIKSWTAGSLTATLTLKTLRSSGDTVFLDVTNAIVSDPSFKTGTEGVDPVSAFGGQISVTLPANPAEQQTDSSASIDLYFNLGNDYETKMIEIKSGSIKISPDGKTLSKNPDWGKDLPAGKTEVPAWTAKTPGMDTTFRFGGTFGTNGVYDRHFKYGDWSLTKISP